MSESLEAHARTVFQIVDSQHPENLSEYVHEDVALDFLGVKSDALAAVSEMLGGLYSAIPDQVNRIDNVIVDEPDQKVVNEPGVETADVFVQEGAES